MDDQANASEEVKELKRKVSDLQSELSCLEAELSRLAVQTNLLAKYSDGLFSAGSEAHTSDLLDEITIGELSIHNLPPHGNGTEWYYRDWAAVQAAVHRFMLVIFVSLTCVNWWSKFLNHACVKFSWF